MNRFEKYKTKIFWLETIILTRPFICHGTIKIFLSLNFFPAQKIWIIASISLEIMLNESETLLILFQLNTYYLAYTYFFPFFNWYVSPIHGTMNRNHYYLMMHSFCLIIGILFTVIISRRMVSLKILIYLVCVYICMLYCISNIHIFKCSKYLLLIIYNVRYAWMKTIVYLIFNFSLHIALCCV